MDNSTLTKEASDACTEMQKPLYDAHWNINRAGSVVVYEIGFKESLH